MSSKMPGLGTFWSRGAQEFVAICAHLPTELKDDLKKVAELSEETHRLTAELSRDQVEILERAKEKYRQVNSFNNPAISSFAAAFD